MDIQISDSFNIFSSEKSNFNKQQFFEIVADKYIDEKLSSIEQFKCYDKIKESVLNELKSKTEKYIIDEAINESENCLFLQSFIDFIAKSISYSSTNFNNIINNFTDRLRKVQENLEDLTKKLNLVVNEDNLIFVSTLETFYLSVFNMVLMHFKTKEAKYSSVHYLLNKLCGILAKNNLTENDEECLEKIFNVLLVKFLNDINEMNKNAYQNAFDNRVLNNTIYKLVDLKKKVSFNENEFKVSFFKFEKNNENAEKFKESFEKIVSLFVSITILDSSSSLAVLKLIKYLWVNGHFDLIFKIENCLRDLSELKLNFMGYIKFNNDNLYDIDVLRKEANMIKLKLQFSERHIKLACIKIAEQANANCDETIQVLKTIDKII